MERKAKWSEDGVHQCLVQWGDGDKPIREAEEEQWGSGGRARTMWIPEGKKESVSRSEQLCQVLLSYKVERAPRLSLRFSYVEVPVTLMRTVTGKQRGTSLIQVGPRADSKDTILKANLD